MDFSCHVTHLPHFINEAPEGRLREPWALPKVTQPGAQGSPCPLHAAAALPVPQKGGGGHAGATALAILSPVCFSSLYRISSQNSRRKKVVPPELWKLFQWVRPWKNSQDLRVGR